MRTSLIRVTYPGSGNYTEFAYGPTGECVKIVETVASSVVSTKQFIRSGALILEERDGAGSLGNGKQFFALGQVGFSSGSPTNHFYTQDHPGSTREMTDGSGAIVAQYSYGQFGEVTKIQGSSDADMQFTGLYAHQPSGLNLSLTRAYSPTLGRWINRDPIAEAGGTNLYTYVGNMPTRFVDPLGLIGDDYVNRGPGGFGPMSDQSFWNAVDIALWLIPEGKGIELGAAPALRGMKMLEQASSSMCHMAGKPKKGPPNLDLLGALGTQTTSSTLWSKGKVRIDVENPSPGYRPGQVHMQEGSKGAPHWIIDPNTRQFADPNVPGHLRDLLNSSGVQNAINKARTYLGLP